MVKAKELHDCILASDIVRVVVQTFSKSRSNVNIVALN